MVRYSERLGEIVMTTDPRRALARDLAARTLLRIPAGRRYLTQMRYRPRVRHAAGLVTGDHELTGTVMPQPRVLVAPSLRPQLLDEVLGESYALLGVDIAPEAWRAVDASGWLGDTSWVKRIDVYLGDRLPPSSSPRAAVADADGRLEAALGSARNHFVLVKPDRYIAAVIDPGSVGSVAATLGHIMR